VRSRLEAPARSTGRGYQSVQNRSKYEHPPAALRRASDRHLWPRPAERARRASIGEAQLRDDLGNPSPCCGRRSGASIGEAHLPDDLGDRPLAMFAEQGVEFAINSSESTGPFLD